MPDVSLAGGAMADVPFEPREVARVGLVGLGRRQIGGLLFCLLNIDAVEIVAVCDPDPEAAAAVAARVGQSGQRPPTSYATTNGFAEMIARDDVELVCVGTPWELHAPMAVAAMNAGKHVAVEVPAAVTVEDCWALVEASERNQRHCVMLENCCYGYNELLVLNMVRAGMFGDLIHGEAAYIHDLRAHLMEQDWRRLAHVHRNGNLYPTHGLGPVASYMDINRGDRFESMVSMSSAQRSLERWRTENIPSDDPRSQETYRCGDINTSIIRTAAGRTILLQHDIVSPRPYDRRNLISGTKGVFEDFPARIYFDGQKPAHEFTTIDAYKDAFEHTLWKRDVDRAERVGGHGGMDFLMLSCLIEAMRTGTAPHMDVYDAAAWSVPGPLSEQSVAGGGAVVEVPDFTRGAWKRSNRVVAFGGVYELHRTGPINSLNEI